MKSKKNSRKLSPKTTEMRELRFAWIAFSVIVMGFLCVACAVQRAQPVTVAVTAALLLLGGAAYAVIAKFGRRLWEIL